MPRPKNLNKMSYAELSAMQAQIEKAKAEKQNQERATVRQKLVAIAKEAGFDIHDLFGKVRGGGRGSVAVKYRDSNGNTWTGRGRMPRWLTAALRGGKAKRDDFLVK
jgi:DNA-binding protein H-NS